MPRKAKPQPPQNKKTRRRKDGTFPKGVSGNPGGRPKEEREIVEALRRRADELVASLLGAALRKKPDVKAITEALNRAYGKARQVVDLKATIAADIDFEKLPREKAEKVAAALEVLEALLRADG